MSDDESLTAPVNTPPTVSEERAQRAAHVEQLRIFLLAHPWDEITADELRDVIGPNYQQRISDVRKRGLCVENVPKWETFSDGSKRKLSGSYIYKPQEALGRDPSTPAAGADMPSVQPKLDFPVEAR